MGDSGFERFMDLEIPDDRPLAQTIREVARHYDTMTPDEYKGVMLSIFGGAIMQLEEDILDLRRQLSEAKGMQ